MKKPFLLLLLINLYTVGQAQIIKGIIQDQQNDSIITTASVYINGTTGIPSDPKAEQIYHRKISLCF